MLFHLLDGAVPFTLTGRTVRVYGVKPDGAEIFNDLQIVDAARGICKLELTTQILALGGNVEMELMTMEGESKLTSIPFTLEVVKSLNSRAAIESKDEFKALDTALIKTEAWNNEFTEKSGKLEELYTPRLNEVSSQLAEIAYGDRNFANGGEISNEINYKPLFTIIADDGLKENYTILRPLALELGINFSMCVYVESLMNGVSTMCTLEELKTIQSEGNEIMSHGYKKDAQITLLPKEQWHQELGFSKDYLISQGFYVKNFVYQGGAYNNEVMQFMARYYNSAFVINEQSNYAPINNFEIKRYSFDYVGQLANIKTKIDEIYSKGTGWVVLMIHPQFEPWKTEEKKQELRDLIAYVKSKNIEIVTADKGLETYGNVIDVGKYGMKNYLKVTRKGEIFSNYNRYNSYPDNTITPEMPPSFFREGTEGIANNNSGSTIKNFPTEIGTLKIISGMSKNSRQYWYPWFYGKAVEYHYERSAISNTQWGEWKKINSHLMIQEEINSANPNLGDYPGRNPGVVTKSGNKNVGYYVEEYDVYNKNKKYKRFKKSSGEMSEWYEYCFKVKIPITKSIPQMPTKMYYKIEFDIASYGLAGEDVIVLNSILPGGLMYSISHNGTIATLNLFNVSDSTITGQTLYLNCFALKGV